MQSVIVQFMDQYGVLAFGTVSALLLMIVGSTILIRLWRVMVSPVLETSRSGQEAFVAASAHMATTASALQSSANSNAEAMKQSRALVGEQLGLLDKMNTLADRLGCKQQGE